MDFEDFLHLFVLGVGYTMIVVADESIVLVPVILTSMYTMALIIKNKI